MQAAAVTALDLERRPRIFATAFLCALAIAGSVIHPVLGFAVAAVLAGCAVADWAFSVRTMLGALIIVILVIPAGLRIGGGLPLDVTADRVLLACLLGAWLFRVLEPPSEPLPSVARTIRAPLAGFVAVAAISLLLNRVQPTAPGGASALKGMLLLFGYGATYLLVVAGVRGPRAVESLGKVAVVAGAVAALSAIVERATEANPIQALVRSLPGIHVRTDAMTQALLRGSGVRVFGTGEHPIAFGGAMAMLLPLALYFAFVDAKRRPIWGGLAMFLAAAMLFSVSRSALIAACLGFLVLLACWPRRRTVLILAVVAGLLAAHLFMPGLLGTFRATLTPSYLQAQESAANDDNRASDYPKVAVIVPKQVLFGLGFDQFDPERYFYLDNQVLKTVLELGVAGALMFGGFVFLTMRTLVRAVRAGPPDGTPIAGALLASITVFCVLSLFFDTFSFVQVTYLFLIFCALSVHVAAAPADEVPACV